MLLRDFCSTLDGRQKLDLHVNDIGEMAQLGPISLLIVLALTTIMEAFVRVSASCANHPAVLNRGSKVCFVTSLTTTSQPTTKIVL